VAADAAFNGTVVISVKRITASTMATFALKNSSGTVTHEQRVSTSNTNTFSGIGSGRFNTTGTYNLFSGYQAGYSNTTGEYNGFNGQFSGTSNTTGSSNSFFGPDSGFSNTTGSNNIFFGNAAGRLNTTANYNLFIGYAAGYSNTTASNNVFIGNQSGYSNITGTNNCFIGYQSGYSTKASNNTFQGSSAGWDNTTGSGNTYQGCTAGEKNTTGSNNLFLGLNAGKSIGTAALFNTICDNSTMIGVDSRPFANNEANAIVIGYQGRGLGSNTSVIGNSTTTRAKIWGSLENQSSGTTTGTSLLIQNTTPVELLKVLDNGKTSFAATNTAAGTTGAQTINKASGTVNFAAAATSLVVTNSLCTTSSIVFAVIRTNDATAWIENVVPAAGSFTINLGAAATAETSVGFFIIN
jgi:hypothetical protein